MATEELTVIYKDIPGFPGYRVGDDGSVWCRWRQSGLGYGRGTKRILDDKWRLLKTRGGIGNKFNRYVRVNINRSEQTVHRLVLIAFVGPCPNGMVGCHNDGNRLNNRLANLRWDTPKSNEADKIKHGTTNRGERAHFAKLTVHQVVAIREEYARGQTTYAALGTRYGVNWETIRYVIKRRSWKHVG